MTATAENLILVYLGTTATAAEKTFLGTIVAPNAALRLAVGGTPHVGQFFAKTMQVDPRVKVNFKPYSRWDALVNFSIDSDCDGIPDSVETSYGLNPNNPADALADPDGDGIRSRDEVMVGGNPLLADTDHDGIGDMLDLPTTIDLDGDGKPYASDNCPEVTNPGQADADHDGIGDVCDDTPLGDSTTSLVALAPYRAASGDSALSRPGLAESGRWQKDLKGLVQSDWSVLAFERPLDDSSVEVFELFHPAGAHAYTGDPAEQASLIAAGYQVLGTLGFFQPTAPALGVPVLVRRFQKSIAGHVTHAFAVTSTQASALTTEGFTEVAALGYGLTDQGRMSRSKLVFRYVDAAGKGRYRLAALAEIDRTGWTVSGRKFRVLPRANPNAVPLYRMSKPGSEILALSNELAGFTTQGYSRVGILGFVYPAGSNVSSAEPLENLYRVTGTGKDDVYTTDFNEAQQLLTSGYSNSIILARAVALRGRDRFRDGQTCKGETGIDQRINDSTVGTDPIKVASSTLIDLGVACTLKRIAVGTGLTSVELAVRDKLAKLDPAVVQYATATSARLLGLTSAARASLLGQLAALDPGACTGPVDWDRLWHGTNNGLRVLSAPNQFGNGGTQAGTLASLVKLRAPQCQGVTYAAGDPASANDATKAITATTADSLDPGCKPGEQNGCTAAVAGRINPIVYGILTGGSSFPADGALDQWAGIAPNTTNHEHIGLPLAGIDVGSCTTPCSQALGQACINGECRSFPMVKNGVNLTISGANFWDLSTARVILTRVSTGDTFEAPVTGINVPEVVSASEFPARCDPSPLDENGPLGVLNGPPVDDCPQGQICPDLYVRDIGPNEKFVESITFPVNLPDGMLNDFYTVQVVNSNGSYVPRAELIPLDPAQLPTVARTVHVCAPPACDPIPASDVAACSVAAIPVCGGGVGGVWNTPPRSLAACKALLATSGDPTFQCEETPFRFTSSTTTDSGAPLQFFAAAADKPTFIQPQMTGLYCGDETGWDAMGDDEIVVSMASIGVKELAVGDLEASTDVYTTDINRGDSVRPGHSFRSVQSDLTNSVKQGFMLQVGEDDDIGSNMVITVILTTAAGAAGAGAVAGAAATATVLGTAIAAVSGGSGGLVAGMAWMFAASGSSFFDPDDFIGQDGWIASSTDVVNRGQISHSPPLDDVPLFQDTNDSRYILTKEGGKHPGVDNYAVSWNSDLHACVTASDCPTSRNPICFEGACVNKRWVDSTVPYPFNPATDAPGNIEHFRMIGDSTDYELWISTTVSGKQ